jgi:hypothetical protein
LRSKVDYPQVPISIIVVIISFLLAFNAGMRETFVLYMRFAFNYLEMITGFSAIFSEARVRKLRERLQQLRSKKNPETIFTPEEMSQLKRQVALSTFRAGNGHDCESFMDSDGEEISHPKILEVITVRPPRHIIEQSSSRNLNEDPTVWTNIRQRLGSPLSGSGRLFRNRQRQKDSEDVESGEPSGS